MHQAQNNALQLLYVPMPNLADAQALAERIVAARLVACVNILPSMVSVYHWQGDINTAQEAVMIAKTTPARAPEAVDFIRAHHPYDCPAILNIPVTAAPDAFLAWIRAEVS